MKEKDFMAQVIDVAHANHWLCAHFRPAMMANGHWVTAVQADGKGYPDLTLVKPPRVLFVEVKGDDGRMSPEQVVWIGNLKSCPGVETYVWRQKDADEVISVLSKGGK